MSLRRRGSSSVAKATPCRRLRFAAHCPASPSLPSAQHRVRHPLAWRRRRHRGGGGGVVRAPAGRTGQHTTGAVLLCGCCTRITPSCTSYGDWHRAPSHRTQENALCVRQVAVSIENYCTYHRDLCCADHADGAGAVRSRRNRQVHQCGGQEGRSGGFTGNIGRIVAVLGTSMGQQRQQRPVLACVMQPHCSSRQKDP